MFRSGLTPRDLDVVWDDVKMKFKAHPELNDFLSLFSAFVSRWGNSKSFTRKNSLLLATQSLADPRLPPALRTLGVRLIAKAIRDAQLSIALPTRIEYAREIEALANQYDAAQKGS